MNTRLILEYCVYPVTILLVASLFGGCGQATGEQNESPAPNIVFILADDLGYSDIGAYGSEIETPNLDRLANNGIRFTQMHNTSKCFPSRAVLLTGQYAQQVGMSESAGDFEQAVMFGEVLSEADYTTIFVGKHHSTDNPYEWGFDHYWGLRDGAANYFNPGEQRPRDPGPPAQKPGFYPRTFAFDDSLAEPYTPPGDYYGTDSWTDWALELLGRYEEDSQPFMLYLSYQAPHDPLQAPEEDIKKYEGVYEAGYEAIAQARYERQRRMGLLDERYPRSEPTHRPWSDLDDSTRADQLRRMQVYAAMIDRLDQNIGRLIDYLEERGELDNTLIMFASDNGASAEVVQIGEGPIGSMTRWASLKEDWANVANTPFRLYKNYSHEGGTATPFIVHWPEVISEGGQIDHSLLHFIDIMPTLVEVSGAEYPDEYRGEPMHPMKGVSLLPLLRGDSIEREQPLYYEWNSGRAVQTEKWKLVRWEEEWELYDRQTDRTETTNLAGQHPDVVNRLESQWREWAGYSQGFDTAFDHQALVVSDLDSSASFYKEILGLKEIKNETGKPTRRWFSLGGDLQLHLLADEMEGVKVNKSIHLAVTISNFDEFVENLRTRDIEFTDWPGNVNQVNYRPDGVKQVYIKDPDGYSIEVNSRTENL